MSNLAVIAAHYEASARADLPGMLAALAPDVRWTEAEGSRYAGTYVGPDAVVAKVLQPIASEWEGFAVEVDRLIDAGDQVVALGHYSGAHRRTGRRFRARMVHVWLLAEERVIAFEQIVDNEPINAAAEV